MSRAANAAAGVSCPCGRRVEVPPGEVRFCPACDRAHHVAATGWWRTRARRRKPGWRIRRTDLTDKGVSGVAAAVLVALGLLRACLAISRDGGTRDRRPPPSLPRLAAVDSPREPGLRSDEIAFTIAAGAAEVAKGWEARVRLTQAAIRTGARAPGFDDPRLQALAARMIEYASSPPEGREVAEIARAWDVSVGPEIVVVGLQTETRWLIVHRDRNPERLAAIAAGTLRVAWELVPAEYTVVLWSDSIPIARSTFVLRSGERVILSLGP